MHSTCESLLHTTRARREYIHILPGPITTTSCSTTYYRKNIMMMISRSINWQYIYIYICINTYVYTCIYTHIGQANPFTHIGIHTYPFGSVPLRTKLYRKNSIWYTLTARQQLVAKRKKASSIGEQTAFFVWFFLLSTPWDYFLINTKSVLVTRFSLHPFVSFFQFVCAFTRFPTSRLLFFLFFPFSLLLQIVLNTLI